MCLFQQNVRMSDSSVGRACNDNNICIYAHGFEPSLCLFYVCFFTKFWIILSYSIKFKAWISMKSVEFDTVSYEILIVGFQKGKTQSCTSRGTKVTGCQIFKFLLQTLTSCNFDAAWGTRLCFTLLETSN